MKENRKERGPLSAIASGVVEGIIAAALTLLLTFAVFLLVYYCLIPMLSDLAGLIWAILGMPLLAQTPVLPAYDLGYRYGGLLGLPISALWTALAQLVAVRAALNHWQADHFCPEE